MTALLNEMAAALDDDAEEGVGANRSFDGMWVVSGWRGFLLKANSFCWVKAMVSASSTKRSASLSNLDGRVHTSSLGRSEENEAP